MQSENMAAETSAKSWLEPNFESILPELKAIPNWVLAKAVEREGKITKPPCQPNGKAASHSNPETWSTFDVVRSAYDPSIHIGVGFVLDGKPHFGGQYLHGFDWDNCIIDGQIDPDVKRVIRTLEIPRMEISVSGSGLRGFFLHETLISSRRVQIDGRSVELYSDKRYMTTTGRGKGALA